jgi:hypothetical protein
MDARWYLLQSCKRTPALESLLDRWTAEQFAEGFPENLTKWQQWIIDEFNVVLAAHECKCDQELLEDVIALHGTPASISHTFTSSISEPESPAWEWTYHADGSFEPALGDLLGFSGIPVMIEGTLYVRLWIVPYEPEYNPPYELVLTTSSFFLSASMDCDGYVTEANSDSYSIGIGATSVTLLEERLDITWVTGGASCCSWPEW